MCDALFGILGKEYVHNDVRAAYICMDTDGTFSVIDWDSASRFLESSPIGTDTFDIDGDTQDQEPISIS